MKIREDKVSETVRMYIRTCYAKLASEHFDKAKKSIGSMGEFASGRPESTDRMVIVEDYLKRAGADASKFNFRG